MGQEALHHCTAPAPLLGTPRPESDPRATTADGTPIALTDWQRRIHQQVLKVAAPLRLDICFRESLLFSVSDCRCAPSVAATTGDKANAQTPTSTPSLFSPAPVLPRTRALPR